ncbi:MAG: ABC transporter substrate-binding protein [Caldisericaceae bacterium]
MKRRFFVLLTLTVFVFIITFILAGCQFFAKPYIKIGVIIPISGSVPAVGASAENGCRMAVDEANASKGVIGMKVAMIVEDDKETPEEGKNAALQLIDKDKVCAIVGTPLSKVALAVAPVCQDAKIPLVVSTATNNDITKIGDYIFRACFNNKFEGEVAAEFAKSDLKASTAAVIYDFNDAFASNLAECFKESFEKLGGRVTSFVPHPTDPITLVSYIDYIMKNKPDVIFCPDLYNEAALFAKEARASGFDGPLLGGDGWDSTALISLAGSSINNSYFVDHFSIGDPRPEVQEFVKKYTEKFGEPPDVEAALDYDAMNIVLTAIAKAHSTEGSALRDAIRNNIYDGVTGRIQFDKDGETVKDAVIIKIVNGQMHYLKTISP